MFWLPGFSVTWQLLFSFRKIHLHDECESMKITIDGVKSRLGKLQMHASSVC